MYGIEEAGQVLSRAGLRLARVKRIQDLRRKDRIVIVEDDLGPILDAGT